MCVDGNNTLLKSAWPGVGDSCVWTENHTSEIHVAGCRRFMGVEGNSSLLKSAWPGVGDLCAWTKYTSEIRVAGCRRFMCVDGKTHF